MSKIVIISGINGQISQYLAKHIQEEDPNILIIGTLRNKSSHKDNYLFDPKNVKFEIMDLGDAESIEQLIVKYKPHYFINAAGATFVGQDGTLPAEYFNCNAVAVLNQLEAIRKHSHHTRYVSLGSSEEFGDVKYSPQDESHPISPHTPYGASKSIARLIIKTYREFYKLYAVQGWLFNSESILRKEKFLPRKISKGVARIHNSLKKKDYGFEPIQVGNLEVQRAWQHAADVADGIWRILNQKQYNIELKLKNDSRGRLLCPFETKQDVEWLSENIKEYILSASQTHSVRELIELAFKKAGILGVWHGEGENERYLYSEDGFLATKKAIELVTINKDYYRSSESDILMGDSSSIKADLKWKPKHGFEDLIAEMVEFDINNP